MSSAPHQLMFNVLVEQPSTRSFGRCICWYCIHFFHAFSILNHIYKNLGFIFDLGVMSFHKISCNFTFLSLLFHVKIDQQLKYAFKSGDQQNSFCVHNRSQSFVHWQEAQLLGSRCNLFCFFHLEPAATSNVSHSH